MPSPFYNKLREHLAEHYPDAKFFESPSYDNAVLGFEPNTGRVIYERSACIDHLQKREGMTWEEAEDFFEYNTMRALDYMDAKTKPIIIVSHFD